MFTEIPVRNPIITEYDTNRVCRPRRTSPVATSTAPAISAISTTARGRWSAGTLCSADPAASEAADVAGEPQRQRGHDKLESHDRPFPDKARAGAGHVWSADVTDDPLWRRPACRFPKWDDR